MAKAAENDAVAALPCPADPGSAQTEPVAGTAESGGLCAQSGEKSGASNGAGGRQARSGGGGAGLRADTAGLQRQPGRAVERLAVALYRFEQKYGEGRPRSRTDRLPGAVLLETGDEVDWERVAELARLDRGEQLVLEMRRMGFTRRMALEACLRPLDRRIIRAAWRRLERHRRTLEQVLKSGQPHRARRIEADAVPQWQMCLMEMEDGRFKMFFRRVEGGC